MKNFSNNKVLKTLLFFLILVTIVKTIWLVVTIMFLPKSGIEHIETPRVKSLHYSIKLANPSKKEIKPVKKVVKRSRPTVNSMRGIKLIALIYSPPDTLVVTVKKGRKTKVLAKGEDIDGFVLESGGADYAIFKKNQKEFRLSFQIGNKNKNNYSIEGSQVYTKKKDKEEGGIVDNEDGNGKIVPKGLLTSYTSNLENIWKDIHMSDYIVDGRIAGFKVDSIKKGSDFYKLGLRKGDVLKAVNGEELDNYNIALYFYKELKNIQSGETLTLTIMRNNQTKEIEYEIK